jgi:hypothetical protein
LCFPIEKGISVAISGIPCAKLEVFSEMSVGTKTHFIEMLPIAVEAGEKI